MTKINQSIAAMKSLRAVNLSLDTQGLAQDVVKEQKAKAHEASVAWFKSALASDDTLEVIAANLTQAGQAMRQAGEFGSDLAKVKEGSRKSVASHNHERAMRFSSRQWNSTYAKEYGFDLRGSTTLIFVDHVIKADKVWTDTITETLQKQGLLSPAIDSIISSCQSAITAQSSALAELVASAEQDKAAKDKEQDGLKELAAAEAMSALLGITVNEALKEISERRVKQA